jgi:hypothetical protein
MVVMFYVFCEMCVLVCGGNWLLVVESLPLVSLPLSHRDSNENHTYIEFIIIYRLEFFLQNHSYI